MPAPHTSATHFAMKPTFSIGIEEEYQTVDPETRDLRSHIQAEILEKGQLILQERVKAEMHQSVVEVGTGVCKNIKEAKAEVKMLRRDIIRLARENGLRLASVATLNGDKKGKDLAKDANKILDRIVKDYPDTPWAVLAKRDKLTNLGLEFQAAKLEN